MAKCRNQTITGCTNYGNDKNGGLCNGCFKKSQNIAAPVTSVACAKCKSRAAEPGKGSLCGVCYEQHIAPVSRICKKEGCMNEIYADGLCAPHVAQLNSQPVSNRCKVGGCDYFVSKNGMCNYHNTHGAQAQTSTPGAPQHCVIPGCDNFASQGGRCNRCTRENRSVPSGGGGEVKTSEEKKSAPGKSTVEKLQEALAKLEANEAESKTKSQGALITFSDLLMQLLTKPVNEQSGVMEEIAVKVSPEVLTIGCNLLASANTSDEITQIASSIANHLHIEGMPAFLTALGKSLRIIGRFTTFCAVSSSVSRGILANLTRSQAYSVVALPALFDYLLGYSHSPDLFLALLPALLRCLDEAEQSEDLDEKVASELSSLLKALMLMFPWFSAVDKFLTKRLAKYPKIPRAKLDERIAAARWKQTDVKDSVGDLASDWVEGEWMAENSQGNLKLNLAEAVSGHSLYGRYTTGPRQLVKPEFAIGTPVLLRYKKESTFRLGTLTSRRPGQVFFTCKATTVTTSRTAWVSESRLLPVLSVTSATLAIGTQLLAALTSDPTVYDIVHVAKLKDGAYVVVSSEGKHFTVPFARLLHMYAASDHADLNTHYDGRMNLVWAHEFPDEALGLFKSTTSVNEGHAYLKAVPLEGKDKALIGRLTKADNHDDPYSAIVGIEANVLESSVKFPLVANDDVAVTSSIVHLNGDTEFLCLGANRDYSFNEGPFTIEATICLSSLPKPNAYMSILSLSDTGREDLSGWTLEVSPEGHVVFGGLLYSHDVVKPGEFTYIRVTHAGTETKMEVQPWASMSEGAPNVTVESSTTTDFKMITRENPKRLRPLLCGGSLNNGKILNLFAGIICEVRLWKLPRIAMNSLKYTGLEHGLLGYWPLISNFKLSVDLSPASKHALPLTTAVTHAPCLELWKPLTNEQLLLPFIRTHFVSQQGTWLMAGLTSREGDGSFAVGSKDQLSSNEFGAVWARPLVDLKYSMQCDLSVKDLHSVCFQLLARDLWVADPLMGSVFGKRKHGHGPGASLCVRINRMTDTSTCTVDVLSDSRLSETVFSTKYNQPLAVLVHSEFVLDKEIEVTALTLKFDSKTHDLSLRVNDRTVMSTHIDTKSFLPSEFDTRVHVGVSGRFLIAGESLSLSSQSLVMPLAPKMERKESKNDAKQQEDEDEDAKNEDAILKSQGLNLGVQTALVAHLIQLDESLRLSGHKQSWEWERVQWRRTLISILQDDGQSPSSMHTMKQSITAFEESLVIPEAAWSREARGQWKEATLKKPPYKLIQQLKLLEVNIPTDSFRKNHTRRGRWESEKPGHPSSYDGKAMFSEATSAALTDAQRGMLDAHVDRMTKVLPSVSPDVAKTVLLAAEHDINRSVSVLLNRVNKRLDGVAADPNFTVASSLYSAYLPLTGAAVANPFEGSWRTNRGQFDVSREGPFTGARGGGEAMTSDSAITGRSDISSGHVFGYLFLSQATLSTWTFHGVFVDEGPEGALTASPCKVNFSKSTMQGVWNFRRMTGLKQHGESDEKPSIIGFSGLTNNGNTCYQNSFLQALFATKQFRRCLLGLDLSGSAPGKNEDGDEPDGVDGKSEGNDATSDRGITRELQRVFGFMQLTQRPFSEQASLQRLLQDPFNGNQQQDCHQYGQYLLNQVESATKNAFDNLLPKSLPAPDKAKAETEKKSTNLIQEMFGGEMRNVIRCHECGNAKHTDEKFTDLGVSLPKRYAPITDILVISGTTPNVELPEGYERISRSTNQGRKHAPYTYICVRRDKFLGEDTAPITDVIVCTGVTYPVLPPKAGYEVLEGDLNENNLANNCVVQLAVRRLANESPVTDLMVHVRKERADAKAVPAPIGFEEVEGNLNRNTDGHLLKLCVARTMPLRRIQLVLANSAKEALAKVPQGFRFLPANLNYASSKNPLSPNKGEGVYLGFTAGGTEAPITGLTTRIADNKTRDVKDPTKQILPYTIGNQQMELVLERGNGCPVSNLQLFSPSVEIPKYGAMEQVNIAPPSDKKLREISSHPWMSSRGDSFEFLPLTSKDPEVDVWEVECDYGTQSGKIRRALLVAKPKTTLGFQRSACTWVLNGGWTEVKENGLYRWAQFEFSETCDKFTGFWTAQGGKRSAWNGEQLTTLKTDGEPDAGGVDFRPIVDVMLIMVGVEVPPGYKLLQQTVHGLSGRLNADEKAPEMNLAVLYADKNVSEMTERRNLAPITDFAVCMHEVEPVQEGWEVVQMIVPNNKVSDFELSTQFSPDAKQLDADPNFGTNHGGQKLYLSIRRAVYHAPPADSVEGEPVPPVYRGSMLTGIGVNHHGKPVEQNFARILQTPGAMLSADLNLRNQGLKIFIETRFETFTAPKTAAELEEQKAMRHAVEGTWNTTEGAMVIKVVKKHKARYQHGIYMIGDKSGKFEGHIFSNKTGSQTFYGLHKPSMAHENHNKNCIQLHFNKDGDQLHGDYTWQKEKGNFSATKNTYSILAFKKDLESRWVQGKELFSSIADGNHLQQMLNFSPEVLGGSNMVTCDVCKRKTIADKNTYVTTAPEHLIVTVKRFRRDYRTGTSDKILNQVDIAPTLDILVPPEKDLDVVFDGNARKWRAVKDAKYGLYAVIVHSGSRLNGGHYYAFTRDSEADLSQKDDPIHAPWIRMNDSQLSVASWDEIEANVRTSINDTAYMLVYGKLQSDAANDDQKSLSPLKMVRSSSEFIRTYLRGKSAPTQQVNPALHREVMEDNRAYVNEAMKDSSIHFLRHLNTILRSNAQFKEPFAQHGSEDEEYDHVDEKAAAVADIELQEHCNVCLLPGGHGDAICPQASYVLQECAECHINIFTSEKEQHALVCSANSAARPAVAVSFEAVDPTSPVDEDTSVLKEEYFGNPQQEK